MSAICLFCGNQSYKGHRSDCFRYRVFKMPEVWSEQLGLPNVGPIWGHYPITEAEFHARQRNYGGQP